MARIDVMPIKRYLDNETEDFYEVFELCLGKKAYIIDYLNRAKKILAGYEQQIEEVLNNLEYHYNRKITKENFKKLLHDLDCYELSRSNYMVFMKSIIVPSEEEAIEYIRKSGLTKKQILTYFNNFIKRFPNQTEQIEYVSDIYEKYYEKYKMYSIMNESKSTIIGAKDEKTVLLLIDIYNSKLCYEEYLSNIGNMRIQTFINDVLELTIPTKEKYQKLIDEVMNRDNKEFYEYLIQSAYDLVNKEDFDILDYHNYTNLPYEEYIRCITNLLGDCELVRNLRRKLREKYKALPDELQMSERNILEGSFFIRDREVTCEERQKIVSYIKDNNLSLSLYRIILRKYLNDEIDLNQKVMIKR